VLTGPDVRLRFTRREPASLEGIEGTWVLEAFGTGTAGTEPRGDRATLELSADGSLLASTGCRTLTARYRLSVDEVVATDLPAEGDCPEELLEQDSYVVSVFEGRFRAALDGDRLILTGLGDGQLVYRADAATDPG
jgi:heat shock protein HslJ